MSDPNPKIQTLVGDADISLVSIATQVTQLDNGIWSAVLTAENEDAAKYLSSLVLGQTIRVRMIPDSNPPTSIDWDTDPTVVTTFVGTIQILAPKMSIEGQVCSVTAFGNGFQLRQMRIAKEYGYIYPIPEWGFPYTFTGIYKNWSFLNGSLPYIQSYSYFHYLSSSLAGHVGIVGSDEVGGFTFGINKEYDGGKFTSYNGSTQRSGLELHIVAGIYPDSSSGYHADTVTISPLWSIDGGNTWNPFTSTNSISGNTHPTTFVVSSVLELLAGKPYWSPYGLVDPHGGAFLANYQPSVNYPNPPVGQDIGIDLTVDIPFWDSRFQVMFIIGSSSGTHSTSGGVSIAEAYLYYNFNETTGKTVRQLVAGDNGSAGLIPDFVNNILPITVSGLPTILNSGYPAINTDYVVMDDPTVNGALSQISYLKFPYEDCLTALQDIVKYASALKFLIGNSGYHWIIDTLGNLVIAPTTSHDVYGDHWSGEEGPFEYPKHISDVWTLQPYMTPLKVRVNMITQDFKTELPEYNFVMVAGQFQLPLNDDICRGKNLSSWQTYVYSSGRISEEGGDGSLGVAVTVNPLAYENGANGPCLELDSVTDGLVIEGFDSVYFYPIQDSLGNTVDFTQLMGQSTVPSVNFNFKQGGDTGSYEVRLYIDDGTGHPKLDTWFACPFQATNNTNQWGYVKIDFPNVAYFKDYGNWAINTVSFAYIAQPASLDWGDFNKVKYFAIKSSISTLTGTSKYYLRLKGLSFNGTVIRAAFDLRSILGGYTIINKVIGGTTYVTINDYADHLQSITGTQAFDEGGITELADWATYQGITLPIKGYGCRMSTIRDTFAQTDTLTDNDYNPLALEAIYDLQRYRKVRTTGEIEIPLDPKFVAGQQQWLQAEETIPVNFQILSNPTNPTTSTVGVVGMFYVNTANFEVFKCTAVDSVHGVYTWVDQGYVQYKINKLFRITKVIHSFTKAKAVTRLTVTDDLTSSLSVDTRDVYTVRQRENNPDFQSKTQGSLKSNGTFDLGLPIIGKDYSGYSN